MSHVSAFAEQPTSERTSVAWTATIAAALVVAVVLVPPALAATDASLTIPSLPDAVSRGLDAWVGSGAPQPGDQLEAAASFWREFHLAKAILAIFATGALAMLSGRIWNARRAALPQWRRLLWMLAGVASTFGMALALVIAIANVQGAVAPLASVVSFLPSGDPTPAMRALASDLASVPLSAPAASLLSDFAMYHAVVAACAAAAVVGLVFAAVRTWRRWLRRAPETRSGMGLAAALGAYGVFAAALSLVVLANVSTALDPTPALVSFLGG